MKKHILFTAILSLFMLVVSASAQKTPNFAGTWTLDIAKSKLTDREKAVLEFQSITAVQNDKDIQVTTTTKRVPPPGAPAGSGPSGGAMGPSSMTSAFTFDGKEVASSVPGPNGSSMPLKTSSKWEGSKLVLTTSRVQKTPEGEVTVVTKDTWDLSSDGKTLTITRENTSPQGTSSTIRVHNKS